MGKGFFDKVERTYLNVKKIPPKKFQVTIGQGLFHHQMLQNTVLLFLFFMVCVFFSTTVLRSEDDA